MTPELRLVFVLASAVLGLVLLRWVDSSPGLDSDEPWQRQHCGRDRRYKDESLWVIEPFNAYTNIGYILAAYSLDKKSVNVVGSISLYVVGVGSFVCHARLTMWATYADYLGIAMLMYALWATLVFPDLRRRAAFVIGLAVPTSISLSMKNFGFPMEWRSEAHPLEMLVLGILHQLTTLSADMAGRALSGLLIAVTVAGEASTRPGATAVHFLPIAFAYVTGSLAAPRSTIKVQSAKKVVLPLALLVAAFALREVCPNKPSEQTQTERVREAALSLFGFGTSALQVWGAPFHSAWHILSAAAMHQLFLLGSQAWSKKALGRY